MPQMAITVQQVSVRYGSQPTPASGAPCAGDEHGEGLGRGGGWCGALQVRALGGLSTAME